MELLERFSINALTEKLIASSQTFSCKLEPDIDAFFHHQYREYENQLLGKSYAFVDESVKGVKRLTCAFSVSNSSIRVDLFQKTNRNKFNRLIPNAKRRSQYPAVLVGQLSVFDEYRNRGLGNQLMNFIKGWFIEPNNKTGCRFIVVDAINKEKVLEYYAQNGFEPLFENSNEELKYIGRDASECLKTRLLYFDLKKLREN